MIVTNRGKILFSFFANSILFVSLYRIINAKVASRNLDLNYFIDEFFVLMGISYFYMFGLFMYNIFLTIKHLNKTYIERELEDDSDNDNDNDNNTDESSCEVTHKLQKSKTTNSMFNFYNRFDIWNNQDDADDTDDENDTKDTNNTDTDVNVKSEVKNTASTEIKNNLEKNVLCDCLDCKTEKIETNKGLAERMKSYEIFNKSLIMPYETFIVRIDGHNFTNLTSKCFKKPVDNKFLTSSQANKMKVDELKAYVGENMQAFIGRKPELTLDIIKSMKKTDLVVLVKA